MSSLKGKAFTLAEEEREYEGQITRQYENTGNDEKMCAQEHTDEDSTLKT